MTEMTDTPSVTAIEAAQSDLKSWRKTTTIEAKSDHEFVKEGERRTLAGMGYFAAMGLHLYHTEFGILGKYANDILLLSCIGVFVMFLLMYRKYHRVSVIFDRCAPQNPEEALEKTKTTEQADGEGRR